MQKETMFSLRIAYLFIPNHSFGYSLFKTDVTLRENYESRFSDIYGHFHEKGRRLGSR